MIDIHNIQTSEEEHKHLLLVLACMQISSSQDVVNIESSATNRRTLTCVHGVDQPQHAGRVDAAVRHHVVRVHDLGEHVLEQRHEPGHGAAHHQEQGDQQLLWQRARAPRGGVVQRRGVAAGAHQVQAWHQISLAFHNKRLLQLGRARLDPPILGSKWNKWASR